ncbi:hypothetical protein CSING_00435 [Corynebacterium singulare]|uniref:Uncharacterized protein n=1 Tax=Corynebacterium singulare TaxID=161899 RepID=A0A0B6F0W6_9CORY|nr:hypothetical protein CSING_00435 [Corynebacterium singulare]
MFARVIFTLQPRRAGGRPTVLKEPLRSLTTIAATVAAIVQGPFD